MRCPVCPVTTATCISFERSSELMIYTYLSRDSGVRGAGDVRGGVGGGGFSPILTTFYYVLVCRGTLKKRNEKVLKSYNLR